MTSPNPASPQATLFQALAANYEKRQYRVQVFETHISWVLVVGGYAYKFKKAVRFDFLDFSTLKARHFYCLEELRLNRRLAPSIYLDVVPITGSPAQPVIGGEGEPIEYAVKMHAFEQDALWEHRIAGKLIGTAEIDALAKLVAEFHQRAPIAAMDTAWGRPDLLRAIAEENLACVAALAQDESEQAWTAEVRNWETARRAALHHAFIQRKNDGHVRECHGDLHSGNILTLDGRVEAFDCIEFNEGMRWIDVINEVAFTCMDLRYHGRDELAARFLDRYLEHSGDYAGLGLLRYYFVQRALTRCKVAWLRARQLEHRAPSAVCWDEQGRRYLALAAQSTRPAPVAVVITHGFSGSGKSTLAGMLVELGGAVRLRSDVERKRLRGMALTWRPTPAEGAELYGQEATRQTYARLAELARHIVQSGYPVVVDASFLRFDQRDMFRMLAAELAVPFFILDLHASPAVMRTRLATRAALERDPSDADGRVLADQLAQHDPLSEAEWAQVLAVEADGELAMEEAGRVFAPILALLRSS